MTASAIGILGGTFDPVHKGHIHLALELIKRFNLTQMRLMPSFQPVHRETPTASLEQRLTMLQLAISEHEKLTIDERELKRKGPSYTLLSLQELRDECGATVPLLFILGMDAFVQLDSWFGWQELLSCAHLVVASRQGEDLSMSNTLSNYVDEHRVESLSLLEPSGAIYFLNNAHIDVSSSALRDKQMAGEALSDWVPAAVASYIKKQNLYC